MATFAFALLGLHLCFLCTETSRLCQQRRGIQYIRSLLSQHLGLCHLTQSGEGWDSAVGIKIKACIWILLHVLSAVSLGFEGRWSLALSLVGMVGVFVMGVVTDQSKTVLVNLVRGITAHQLLAMYLCAAHINSITMRRGVFVRTVANLLFIESLEEAFVQLFAVACILHLHLGANTDADSVGLVRMPLGMFFFAVLPMQVLGISEWISASARAGDFSEAAIYKFLKGMPFFACMVSLYLIFVAFLSKPFANTSLSAGLVSMGLGLFLRLPVVAAKANKWIAPNTLRFYKLPPSWPHRGKALVGLSVGLVLSRWTLEGPLFFIALISLIAVLVLKDDDFYAPVQSRLLLVFGLGLLLAQSDTWVSSMLVSLEVFSSFLCAIMTCTRELTFTRIAVENATEAFLSHAIKQKFAAVGFAVEQILLNTSCNSPLLHVVMDECRMGHARCFASNVFRKLEQGERRGACKRVVENLLEQLQTTPMARLLILDHTQLQEAQGLLVEMDWELVHLVLSDLARTGHTLDRVWCQHETPTQPAQVFVKLNRTVHRTNLILSKLLEELQGRATGDLYAFTVRAMRKAEGPPSPLRTKFRAGSAEVLRRLRFALIDDNVLIRKNFQRLLHQGLGVPLESLFAFGGTCEDSKRFPQWLAANQVDVAIFDQNLDFEDDEFLKGSELAREAKRLGFAGCLVLHSSDLELCELLESGVFHGGVEKSADSAKFVEGLVQVWKTHSHET